MTTGTYQRQPFPMKSSKYSHQWGEGEQDQQIRVLGGLLHEHSDQSDHKLTYKQLLGRFLQIREMLSYNGIQIKMLNIIRKNYKDLNKNREINWIWFVCLH